ncbi:MAG: TonB-dependent receptor [Bacteroidota bacterium]
MKTLGNKLTFWIMLLSLLCVKGVSQNRYTVKGTVVDAATGQNLIGANVIVSGTVIGDAADSHGRYLIKNLLPGEYEIIASYIGYDDQIIPVTLDTNIELEVYFELNYSGSNEINEVVVTAQARGQMHAINEQLNAKSIKNVISAERLQELPDANAAEALGRLPGVSIQRSGGEGNKVVVRGLSPKYNKITVDGISMAGTSESDRSTDISMISPYTLDGIEVIKAATAEHDADFMGGAVNFKLRTADPGWKSDIVAQGGYNDLKSTYNDYMFVSSISNRFLNAKLGAYLQLNIERRNRSSNNLGADYSVKTGAIIGEDNDLNINSLMVSDIIRDRSRYGSTLVLDYQLTNGSVKLKNFYNQTSSKQDIYSQSYAPFTRGHAYSGQRERYDLATLSNILNYEQRLNQVTVETRLSHSYSKNDIPARYQYQFNQSRAFPASDDLVDIPPREVQQRATMINDSITTLDRIYDTFSTTKERQIEASFNIQYDFILTNQITGNIKVGSKYRYKARIHDRSKWGADLRIGRGRSNEPILNAFPWMRDELYNFQIPYSMLNNPTFDHKDFMGGQYMMGAVTNLDLMDGLVQVLKDANVPDVYPYQKSSRTHDYSGNEYYSAVFAMTELDFGKYIKFLPGVRYERNKTIYTGIRGITDSSLPELVYKHDDTTMTRLNGFLLPMIHMKIKPFDWFDIRIAYTQTLSRPSYYQIMPRMDTHLDKVTWNNFRLEPEHSRNIDFYFSFKENRLGLFTIGAFTKQIDKMIFFLGRRVVMDTVAYDFPTEYFGSDIYTTANNQYQAYVKGVELDWQTHFWYLPSALKGLVLNINYTHIESQARYPFTEVINQAENPWDPPIYANIDTFYTSQLIDQPDDIINVQIGYDYKGFSTRLSMFYQSSVFKSADFWPELAQYADDYLRWDLSVRQRLPWYGIQLFCNINNITSAEDRDQVKGTKWDAQIQHYGMTIDMGVRVRL